MTAAAEHDARVQLASFGETVRYTPKNGSARNITVIVDEDGEGDLSEAARSLSFTEQVSVFALRDKDNATYGGINTPQPGDTITLDVGLATERSYSFTGRRSRSDR